MKPNRLNRFSLLCSLICYLIVCCPPHPDCPTATARGRPHSRRRQQLLRRRGGIPGRTGQSRRHPADRREPLHRGLLAGAPLGERQQGTSRIRLPQELRRRAVQHPPRPPSCRHCRTNRGTTLRFSRSARIPAYTTPTTPSCPPCCNTCAHTQPIPECASPSIRSGLMPAIPTIRDLRITTTTNPECIGKSSKRSTGSPAKSTSES